MRPLFALLLSVAAVSTLGAQTPGRTLAWCLQQGLASNHSIHIAAHRQASAHQSATRAAAGMLPTVELTAAYGLDYTTARGRARTGGQATTGPGTLDADTRLQLGVTWTAFDGFARQAEYADLGLLSLLSDVEQRMAVEDLMADIAAQYYDCLQQQLRLRNYQSAVRLSGERLRIAEERYRIGSFSRLDRMQAMVDFNADSARCTQQQLALATSVVRLQRMVTADTAHTDAQMAVADTAIAVATHIDYEQMWQQLVQYNTSLQQAAIATGRAQQALRRAGSRSYPYLKINAAYGYTHDRYSAGANLWADRWGPSAGVTMGYTLFDGTRRSAKRAARHSLEVARLQQSDVMLDLKAQFATLTHSHTAHLQLLQLEQHSLLSAQENYAAARDRYMMGDLSGYEMRQAQQSLLDAEERILTAAYNTKMCEISLMLMSGRIQQYLEQ